MKDKSCIDCKLKFSCNKPETVCDRYLKVPGTVTRLDEKDGDSYKFVKMEAKNEKE